MGKIRALIRSLTNNDHFTNNNESFSIPIEMATKGLSKSWEDWPSRLPSWGKNISWANNVATIGKRLVANNEWFCIAVDFDGIINPYPPKKPFPHMGIPDPNVVSLINKLFIEGYCIIIWTVRGGKLIPPLRKYLHDNGILFHYINENPQFDTKYKNLSRKIACNIYWDDRNVCHHLNMGVIYRNITDAFKNALPVDPGQCGVGIEKGT